MTKEFLSKIQSMDEETRELLKFPKHIYIPVIHMEDGSQIFPVKDLECLSTGTFAVLYPNGERAVMKPDFGDNK